MTKAAVKNMLRLLESAEPGEVGNAEIDQYADFIQQQGEIMIGGGDHHNADKSSPRAKRDGATSEKNDTVSADTPHKHHSTVTSENDVVAGVPPSSITPIITAETPAGVNGAPTAYQTTTVLLDRNGGFETGDTGTNGPAQERQVRVHSTQGVSQLLLDRDAASSGATPSPNDVAAAPCPALALTKSTEETLATENNTTSYAGLTDARGSTADKGAVESSSAPLATPSADAECLSSARKLADPESSNSKLKEGERKNYALGKGEETAGVALLPASLSSGSLPNTTETATATAAPPPAGGEPPRSSPQASCAAVHSDANSDGDGVRATAAVGVAADVAPATDVAAGQTVVDEITIPPSPASPETPAALSARERLLRHVRAATSPRSDASSCSSGSDDEEGGVRQAATGAAQLGEGTKPAHEEAGGEGSTPADANGVGGDHDPVTIVSTKTRMEKAGHRVDGRPLTTRPIKRLQAGCGDGGDGEGGEETVTSIDTSGEDGASTTQLPNPSAPAEARDGAAVLLDEVASSVAPTTGDTAKDVEPNIGVTPAPKTASKVSSDTTATEMNGKGSSIGPTQSVGTLAQDNDDSIASCATTRGACDDGIVYDVGNGSDAVGSSTLDATDRVEEIEREDTQDFAASVSTAVPAVRPDTTECEDGNKGEDLPQAAAVGVVAKSESAKAATELDQAAAGNTDGKCIAIPGTTARAAEETEGQATTKPVSGDETDGETTAIEGDGEIAGTGAAAAEPDWIEGYDPGHDCYYYHHVPTGESRWYKPDEPYEPYVHSDEDREGEDAPLSSVEDNSQTAAGGPEDEKDQRRRDRRRQREDDGSIDRKNHRRERTGSGEEERGATSTRSPSAHKSKKSSSRKRRSKSSKASAAESRGRGRNDDDERYVSRSSSRDDRRGDGGRRSKGSSSRQRGKTALERLNDLTDENNSGASGDVRSDDSGGGGGRSHRRDSSSRRGSRGSRRNSNSERHHGSSRKHSSGGRAKTSQSSTMWEKGYYDEDGGARSRSTKSSRGIVSSDGSSGENSDDYKRGTSRTRSGSNRRGSESRRQGR